MVKRNSTIRTRHRKVIARGKPPCHLCGGEIDYKLPWLDPGEFVVDHIIPLALGGEDTLENKAASHRACNLAKGAKLGLPPWWEAGRPAKGQPAPQPEPFRRSGSLRRA